MKISVSNKIICSGWAR